MVYFTRGVNVGALTKVCNLLKYIISVPICHTHMYCTNTEIVEFYFFTNRKIYKKKLLISDDLVSFYLGGDEAEGCKKNVYYLWQIYFLH